MFVEAIHRAYFPPWEDENAKVLRNAYEELVKQVDLGNNPSNEIWWILENILKVPRLDAPSTR